MRRIVIILLVVSLGGSAYLLYRQGYFGFLEPDQAAPQTRFTGLVGTDEVMVSSRFGGRLEQLWVEEGSTVQQGELVATLERAEYEAEIESQEARIAQLTAMVSKNEEIASLQTQKLTQGTSVARAALQSAKSRRGQTIAELAQLRRDRDVTAALLEKKLVPRQELERVTTAVAVSEAQLQALEDQVLSAEAELELAVMAEGQSQVAELEVRQTRAQLQQAQAQLKQLKVRLDSTEIRAPLDGTVSLKVAAEGEVVSSGTPIVVLVNLDSVWVQIEVEESLVERVALGQQLRVFTTNDTEHEGVVTFISPQGRFATQRDVSRVRRDIRTFSVRLTLPNPDRHLHPGMTVSVELPEGPTRLP